MKNKWVVAPKVSEEFKNQFPEIQPVILQLLYNRELNNQKEIDGFLMPDYSQDLHDPFLFSDMTKVVERINQAINKEEKILVYGDYDVDGITSSAVLKLTLEKLGATSIDIYLPDREKEGYGMKENVIKEFAQKNIKLIITCDCGITNNKEIDLANQLGIDVIVTDHHLPPANLPLAYAIIDPHCENKYPFKYLAGVGVAFKVIQALLQTISETSNAKFNLEAFEKWLLDLVAMGTIADNMVLLGENRTLVKYGLIVLNKTKRIGLKSLIKEAKVKGSLETWNIYYQIAPRINAASRIDHASTALFLVLTQSPSEGRKVARELNQINSRRQKIVDEIFQNIKSNFGIKSEEKIIVAQGENWPVGILGLIASKLVDEYSRPAIALTIRDGEEIVGSGRSLGDFNLVALLGQVSHLLSRFGGHKKAAGFTISDKEKIPDFISEIRAIANKELKEFDFSKKLFIEAEVDLKDINWELEEMLEKFMPFGEGNKTPLFLIRNLNIENLQWVGQSNQHLKMVASGHKFIIFCANDKCDNLKLGDKIDVIVELGVNQWNGTKELQMKVIDIKNKNERQ